MTSQPVRFATGTTVRDFAAYREWLRVAEDCGFDMLTCGDSQSLWADWVATMTVAASVTTRPILAVTVSNPMTRHPAVTASAAASVQQISGGRFRFGIGSGDSALRNIGVRTATVEEVGAYVEAVKGMTANQAVRWQGADLALHWLAEPVPVPVWIAAEGPRTQRLAGRIADGVILSNCLTAERMAVAREHLAAGAAEAGREVDDLEVWCMANLVFAPTEAEGIAQIRSVLAGTANHVFRFTLDGKGLPPEYHEPMRALMREYQSRHHAQPGAQNPNEELVDRYGLRDYLASLGTIAGPPERCVERIREVAAVGATNLILAQFVPDQLSWMHTFASRVRPSFQ
jgi:5,10-methylenetetrahydromethanopterin reductase